MARYGYVVDATARTVGGPGGGPYALDQLEMANGCLYYARAIPADASVSYQETWLIPDHSWTVTRFTFHEHLRAIAIDWKMEPDRVERDGALWCVNDGFLDLNVYEGSRYDLVDADELADAISTGEISLEEAHTVLHALDALCTALRLNGYSGRSILRQFVPGLPH